MPPPSEGSCRDTWPPARDADACVQRIHRSGWGPGCSRVELCLMSAAQHQAGARIWPVGRRLACGAQDKVNISVAIIPMAQDFGWSPTVAGLVQSSFFYGVPPQPAAPLRVQ